MDSSAHRPRLCHLRKTPDFAGYGFNLHAEKGKSGQFIGNVDPGSPAQTAGLRKDDRIVEVNGTNVGNENHSQVVERIKAVAGEVTFLVVDPETDAYYHDNKIIITGDMDNIERIGGEVETAVEHVSEPAVFSASDDIATQSPSVPDADVDEVVTNSQPERVEHAEDAEEVQVAAFSATEVQDDHSPLENGVNSTDDEPESVHARLCELKTWSDFAGYGFNLHANRGEPAQFIGKIDAGSPAEYSGLKEGDRIVEVNGINVDDATHSDVVRLIKSGAGTVSLLVVDSKADEHFKNRGQTVASHMSSVERITCPDSNPLTDSTPLVSVENTESAVVVAAMSAPETDAPPPSYVEAADDAPVHHPHRARVCVIHSWKDGRGYGFSMQAQKGDATSGQFIGKIDAGSPAEAAGLRSKDRIIEVNGENIETATHKVVVEKIKSVPDLVRLLVVDAEADNYYTGKGIKVSSLMDNCVERIESPATKPAATAHAHKARHCVINSWKDGRGYGFSMQAQKGDGSAGQFIGKIDAGSPAEAGGLRQGDRIIEVNGDNVEKASHKEVVDKIKSVPDTVKLLVVDSEADKYFKNAGINVSSSMADCIEQITCPTTKPAAAVAAKPTVNVDLPSNDKPADAKPSGSTSPPVVINGIEFAGSAQEARKRMSKKKSVVDDKRSMKDKYELFQKM